MKSLFCIYLIITLFFKVVSAQEWASHGTMPLPVADGQAVVLNGKIYIIGGVSDSTDVPVSVIQCFDPQQPEGKQWTRAGRMQVPRANFVAEVMGDVIIIAGGVTGFEDVAVSSLEMWSPEKGSVLLDTGKQLNRIGASAEVWNGMLIVIGGFFDSAVAGQAISAFNLMDRREVGSIALPKKLIPNNHASFMFEDTIYIAGGVRTGVSKRIFALPIGRLAVGNWPDRIQPEMILPRASFEAVKTAPREAWFIGGYNESDRALSAVSIFNRTSFGYQIRKGPELQSGRNALMAAELNGTIYVFGGRNGHDEIVPLVEELKLPTNTAVVEKNVHTFRLRQNYPNPFNPSTTIEFQLPVMSHVQLDIINANGVVVKTLLNEHQMPGNHTVVWDGTDDNANAVPSGVYFYRLETGSERETRKMLLVR